MTYQQPDCGACPEPRDCFGTVSLAMTTIELPFILSDFNVHSIVLQYERIDGRVFRAPVAVARGQVKLPAVHRAPNRTNGTLAPTLQHPADQRPLAVGTRIVQSIESPLLMEQRDTDAVHLDELARAVRDLGGLGQKNHAAYPQSLTMAVATGWLYALYFSNTSSPSHVRSRFVSIPGKSGHPCSHFC